MPERPTNIDRFNDLTAKLFSMLYGAFPQRLDIDFIEWLGTAYGEAANADVDFCHATLKWLEGAGYVAVGAFDAMGATKIVLTARGLEVLKAIPASLKTKESFGEAIINTLKAGAAGTARQLVAHALTEGARMLGGFGG